ncbi:MAG: tetratricopeptide repeat protein [Elusimicrobia bacterium]|nr:tetratricopeptide repeat protein [Elusimicrobiota bacterium]
MTLVALVLLLACPARAAEPVKASQSVQDAYDQAFRDYQAGEFRKAINKWSDILRADPNQATAKKMIEQARQATAATIEAKRAKLDAHVARGRYGAAFLELQGLLDLDPSDALFQRLQDRLDAVSRVVRAAPEGGGRPWRLALTGLKAFLAPTPDPRLAQNALRYALELAPQERRFGELLALVRAKHPELGEDDVTPGMKLLEHKHLVSLHHIYDARYHAAVAVLQEILQLEPNDVAAWKKLGTAFYSLGRKRQARDAWGRALKLAPNDPSLKEHLSKVQ